MKKIALLLVLVMLMGCFAACGGEEAIEDGAAAGTAAATQGETQPGEGELDVCPKTEDGKHLYEEELVSEATCTEPGLMMYTCTACNDSTTAEIPAAGHQGTGASCDEPSICTICGETAESAWGHVDEGGVCKNCGEDMANVVVVPQPTEPEVTEPESTEPETTEAVESTEAATQE